MEGAFVLNAIKVCTMCGEERPVEQFSWQVKAKGYRRSICKSCEKQVNRRFRVQNKEHLRQYKREWKQKNLDKAKELRRRYADRHPEIMAEKSRRYRQRHPEVVSDYNKRYREENKEKVAEIKKQWRERNKDRDNKRRNERVKNKLEQDRELAISYKLNLGMANSINHSLKGRKNGRSWESLVGYTLKDLMAHLEARFKPGMTWENHGRSGWHIDHIRPIASFNFTSPDDPEFRECWTLENLQPLWAEENLRKGAKVI